MAKQGYTRALGEQLETVALHYLENHGLSLVCRNFQCKLGEIDLVMCEAHKQRKLVRTAQVYLKLKRFSQRKACRFDILGITGNGSTQDYRFDWIPNAFDSETA